MEKTFITITHLDDYDASRFLYPGSKLTLKKTPNEYDDEAIAVYSEKGSKYGYVANSSRTVARGTHSAGYIYRDFDQEIACVVRFRLDDVAIAEYDDSTTLPPTPIAEKKYTFAKIIIKLFKLFSNKQAKANDSNNK